MVLPHQARSGFQRALTALLSAVLVLATTARASAFCGFYVSGADAKLFNNATMVALMRDGLRTVLSMQNNYQGPPENFAMVVPVPVVLQKENVKTLPPEIFDRLDQLAAPRLVEYWEQDPCKPILREEAKGAFGLGMAAPTAATRGGAGLGVTIEAQFTVGEYEIVILSAKDSSGLDTWLRQQNYKIPAGAEPFLRPYVQAGSKFFVAKVNVAKIRFVDGRAKLSPLRFHYDSDKFALPIRLGLINAKEAQDLIVHVLAKGKRYDVANYPNVTIPTNLDLDEKARDRFGAFYAALFDRTVEKTARAVVTEYAWDASSCDPCPTPALTASELATLGADVLPEADGANRAPPPNGAPAPEGKALPPRRRTWSGGFVLTRLHARYTRETLGEDLVFREAPPIMGGREVQKQDGLEVGASAASTNNFQGRYAIRHPWTGPVSCENPVRGVWGGPPGQVDESPKTRVARDVAFVPRGGVELASFVKSNLSLLDVVAPAPSATPQPNPARSASSGSAPAETPNTAATPPPPPPPSRGCAGCTTVASTSSSLVTTLAPALGLLALRVRRRRRNPAGSR